MPSGTFPSVTLFEGIILLIVSGAGGLAWWIVRRIVKMSDNASVLITNINNSLTLICERLSVSETWMEMHEKYDDERHKEMKDSYQVLSNILIDRKPNHKQDHKQGG
jgi:hypothetical protein